MVLASNLVTPERLATVILLKFGFAAIDIVGLFLSVLSTTITFSPALVDTKLTTLGAEIPVSEIDTWPTLINWKEAWDPASVPETFNELLI